MYMSRSRHVARACDRDSTVCTCMYMRARGHVWIQHVQRNLTYPCAHHSYHRRIRIPHCMVALTGKLNQVTRYMRELLRACPRAAAIRT
jgi:hypothetical protein